MLLDPHTPEALILLLNAFQKWSVYIYNAPKIKNFYFQCTIFKWFPIYFICTVSPHRRKETFKVMCDSKCHFQQEKQILYFVF